MKIVQSSLNYLTIAANHHAYKECRKQAYFSHKLRKGEMGALETGLIVLKAQSQNKKVEQKRKSSQFPYCFTSMKILTRSRHPG
jgi:hypothetical protein